MAANKIISVHKDEEKRFLQMSAHFHVWSEEGGILAFGLFNLNQCFQLKCQSGSEFLQKKKIAKNLNGVKKLGKTGSICRFIKKLKFLFLFLVF